MPTFKHKFLILFTFILIQACKDQSEDRIPALPNNLESDHNIRLQINSLTDILKENPENDVALYRIAKLYNLINDTENSYLAAKRFTLLKPNNQQYGLFLINCYIQKGLYVDANDMLEKLKSKVSKSEYEKLALEIFLHNGKYLQADAIVNQQLNTYPNKINFIIKKAEIALALKDTAKTIEMYQKALRVDSNSIDVLNKLASLYLYKKEYTKSLHLSEKVAKMDSNNIEANFNNAISFKNLGFKDSALFYYQKVLKSDSMHAKALYNAAIICLQKKEYLKSENYLKKIVTQNHDAPSLNFKLAYILERQQKFEEALIYYQKIDTLDINYNYAKNAMRNLNFIKQN